MLPFGCVKRSSSLTPTLGTAGEASCLSVTGTGTTLTSITMLTTVVKHLGGGLRVGLVGAGRAAQVAEDKCTGACCSAAVGHRYLSTHTLIMFCG